jgi:hypothetical protein
VAERHPEAAAIIPPRRTAAPGETATTQRDRHLAAIAKHGRMNWQRSSGYNRRSLAEPECIDTKPSSADVFMLGLCAVDESKGRSDATF